MKILSYNVMSGGFDGYDYDALEPERLDLIKQVVESSKPDVVSLIDTFRWDEIYTIEQLCEMFGYKYAYCINLNDQRLVELGHNNGITVFSNVEGIRFETLSLGTRDCVRSIIPVEQGSVQLFSVYLDDLKEHVRLKQVEKLSQHLTEEPSIVCGDFNSFSPVNIEKNRQDINIFLKQNPNYAFLKEQLYDMARGDVATMLVELGFCETAVGSQATFPTKLANISDNPLFGVDFFLTRDVNTQQCKVLFGNLYDKASDHYPIILEI